MERTKFISDNLRYFETDASMQEANQIVNDLVADFTIETFLEIMMSNNDADTEKAAGVSVSPAQVTKCMAVDNYLNFLWRIAYAHFSLRTITVDDLDAFGYYFYVISRNIRLMEYCVKEGFEEVIYAIRELKPIWAKADIQNKSLMAEISKLVPGKVEEAERLPPNRA